MNIKLFNQETPKDIIFVLRDFPDTGLLFLILDNF